jgi:hypothetical protein
MQLGRIATLFSLGLIGLLCVASNSHGQPVPIIIDTDMLTDPEDVNALYLANTLADRGEAEILAKVSYQRDRAACPSQ